MSNAKSIFIGGLMMILISNIVLSTEYYISSSEGNDANDGVTAPWKTIARLNRQKLYPGDNVLFKRGDVWREPTDAYLVFQSGNKSGNITYTAYGSGNNPLFLGSILSDSPSDWVKGYNYWRNKKLIYSDVGNMIYNNSEFGTRKYTLQYMAMEGQGAFYYAEPYVYMASATNPVDYYKKIEIAINRHILYIGSNHHIVIDGLSLRYTGGHGIQTNGDAHNIYILNNDVSNIGGSLLTTNPYVRYGNGIEFWNGGRDIVVKDNRIWEIWDAALTSQGGDNNVYLSGNITFANNKVWNSIYCFEWFNGNKGVTDGILFDHNTCFNIGNNKFGKQRKGYDAGPDCFRFGDNENPSQTENIQVTNNICYNSSKFALTLDPQWFKPPITYDYLALDYNLYYPFSIIFDWLRTNYTLSEFSINISKDVNSREGDPQFIDDDFLMLNTSIGCTMGSDGGYVGAVDCGNNPVFYNYFDMRNYSLIDGYSDRESRIFFLGRMFGCEGVDYPIEINVSYLPFKEYNYFPLSNDCYNKTNCYVRWN